MINVSTYLLREKFLIHDMSGGAPQAPVVALSNRVALTLRHKKDSETIAVRAQNMHSCLRMSARLTHAHQTGGPLTSRTMGFDWLNAWETSLSDYELNYNPQRWVAIYHKGRSVFSSGDHHPFLDVIENCEAQGSGSYEKALPKAEEIFRKNGKAVRIEYDGNVALTLQPEDDRIGVGVIFRGPTKTTTFKFFVHEKGGRPLNNPQCLAAGAAFLEAIQLCFMVGMNEEKIRLGIIERHSREEKQTREARQRIGRLSGEIATLEDAFSVRYRPDRPQFSLIIGEAGELARAVLAPRD